MRQARHLSTTSQTSIERIRNDAVRFVDALAQRLTELDRMARTARRFQVFNAEEYAQFKTLFLDFTDRSEEFQLLSYLAEETLAGYERNGVNHWAEHRGLEEYFRKLQIPMLRQVISTNLRLLRVWDDRLQRGEGLPYGAREVFLETVRVIYNAKTQLLRPRYIALLDESALRDADRAERLLRTLIRKAPTLFNFATENENSDLTPRRLASLAEDNPADDSLADSDEGGGRLAVGEDGAPLPA